MTPISAATLVASVLLNHSSNFINWEGGFQYGGAVTAMGIAAVHDEWPNINAAISSIPLLPQPSLRPRQELCHLANACPK